MKFLASGVEFKPDPLLLVAVACSVSYFMRDDGQIEQHIDGRLRAVFPPEGFEGLYEMGTVAREALHKAFPRETESPVVTPTETPTETPQ